MSDIMSQTLEDAVAVTQSDSTADPAGPFCALQATTAAGLCKVTTIRGRTTTVYLTLGGVLPLAVQRVWSSVTAATGIVGFSAMPFKPSTR